MRIERIELPDELVIEADRRWPTQTWSQVVARGVALALRDAQLAEDKRTARADAKAIRAERHADAIQARINEVFGPGVA